MDQKLVLIAIIICLQQCCTAEIIPTVLVHGGAGAISDDTVRAKRNGVRMAAQIGYEALMTTGDVMDAVQEAVRVMELEPTFNAGYGSVLTSEGKVEMDAAIMNGADLSAGCVSVARDIYHPVMLARAIMDRTQHRYLAGDGAMKFAEQDGFEILPEGSLVTPRARAELAQFLGCTEYDGMFPGKVSMSQQKQRRKKNCRATSGSPGTVGAVAIDSFGNVAAATSTGGLNGKLPGRIGDSPILGAGTYADNSSGCVSATGHGESFMRYNVAARILAQIQFQGLNAMCATQNVLNAMTARFNQTGGVISIDHNGQLGIYFTSERMAWAYKQGNELHHGIEQGEDTLEYTDKSIDFY